VEEVSRHNSAAGWNLQISLAVDLLLAWLPNEGAAEILSGHPDVIFSGSFTPARGKAIPVDGGYRVTGQWPFLSGAHNCSWFVFLPMLIQGDRPLLGGQGLPMQLLTFVSADHVRIVDTWDTLGMRGTGSHDVALTDVFVPERYTAAMMPLKQPAQAYGGPLYRLTVWPEVGLLAPPALGVGRAALEDLLPLARSKIPAYMSVALGGRQVVQRQVAEAEATLGAARAYLYQTFQESWDAAVNSEEITLDRKLRMQLATTHAIVAAARTVDLVWAIAGATAVRNEYRFQQYFRDAHTMTQHAFSSANRYESVGALMLGMESDWAFFAF
jgi:alkylation response protein AidB-like acyl-CoA dehydrogenase